MEQVNVDLGARSYPIYIGQGLLDQPGLVSGHIRGSQVMIVSNETIAPLYLDKALALLDGLQIDRCILPDGETYKNLDTLNLVFDALLSKRHNRSTTLVALGGGVVGDMTGFAAASYQRGVDFIQLPTTLLAQVDSSVGGKTAVNHAMGKNMIGAFYQPRCVVADTLALASLPAREYAAGIAEVVKYGLIADAPFYDWLIGNAAALAARDADALAYAIRRSCENKAAVVARDEREGGLRAILNFGHTFGHAIETHQGYSQWLHGEAVAVGMVMALELSVRQAWIGDGEARRLVELLQGFGLPVAPPQDMTPEIFLEHMAVDKKVLDGRLRLVLLEAIGRAVVTADVDAEAVKQSIAGSLEVGA